MTTHSLAFDATGTGTPVVLLHAFPLDRGMWDRQRAELGLIGRVYTPDLPGFGDSPELTTPPTIEAMADAVAAFLDGQELTAPVVLGGLSMGGYVALAFARRHPGRLRGLVLADTRAEPDDATGKANRDRMIDFVRQNPASAVIEQMLPKLLGETTRQIRPDVVSEVRQIASRQPQDGMARALAAMRDRPDSVPALGAIAVPTLVIVGTEDVVTPPDAARVMASGIPQARLVVLDRAGHLANLEQPAAFNAAVGEFLRSLV